MSVPGAVSAWVELSQKFGKLPFDKLFEPAIDYAANGYPVSPFVQMSWANQARAPSRECPAIGRGRARQAWPCPFRDGSRLTLRAA